MMSLGCPYYSHYPVQYPNRACGPVIIPCNIPSGPVNYPDKKVPIPDTPGYPFTTGLCVVCSAQMIEGAAELDIYLPKVLVEVVSECLFGKIPSDWDEPPELAGPYDSWLTNTALVCPKGV